MSRPLTRPPSPDEYARMSWAARERLVRPGAPVVRVQQVTVERLPYRPAPASRWAHEWPRVRAEAEAVLASLPAEDPGVCAWRLAQLA